MIVGEATVTVAATPDDVYAFVFDLERYRQADRKIGKVYGGTRDGDTGTAEFAGRIRGLPGPRGVFPWTLEPNQLVFGSPIGGPARWFLRFEGRFECTETAEGTVVMHRESFDFKKPWKWLAEPFLRRWLENDTEEEMARFKPLVEQFAAERRGSADSA